MLHVSRNSTDKAIKKSWLDQKLFNSYGQNSSSRRQIIVRSCQSQFENWLHTSSLSFCAKTSALPRLMSINSSPSASAALENK